MSLIIQNNSLLTTIQDLGRNNYRSFGVNPNGVMDTAAMRLINILLGNEENEAVLEIHFPAPKILFEKETSIALGGADFAAKIDGKRIENWQIVTVEKGQILSFDKKIWGNRLYLSIKGGFRIENWLGSKSTNLKAKLGGFEGRILQKGDKLEFKVRDQRYSAKNFPKISQHSLPYNRSHIIRVIEGAEFNLLTPLSLENFLKQTYRISNNSDRMGYRLEGSPLYLLHEKELVSSAVTFGTVQLLPNGQLIVLMADHQTTGGYPRIGNVVSADLPTMAQLGTNDIFKFKVISIEKAENLNLRFEKDFNLLKSAIDLYAYN